MVTLKNNLAISSKLKDAYNLEPRHSTSKYIYPRESLRPMHQETCATYLFIVTLLLIAVGGKENEWMNML